MTRRNSMQKNLILVLPVFVALILFNLGFAAWKDGRRMNDGRNWTPAAISTLASATATPTPGWWATSVHTNPILIPTGTPTQTGKRTK